MSTITLPNIRVSSDLTVGVVLKDGGVAIDWSTLSNIKAYLYADAQRAMAGRCSVSVDEEDATRLVCSYRANKPQYIGVNRIVITCTYRGETKTFDKPALNFVRWTDDQAGQQITIDDPDVDVEIEVEDVSSSILEQAIAAALQAAADAEHAAHLIPNQVLLDCEQATAGANAAAEAANAAGITSVNVSVEDNEPGTPSAECTLANKVLSVIFHYLKGETGDAAGFGTINASFVEDGGDPSVVVTTSGPDTAKNISFTLKNFKGDKGDKGDQGNTGSSVDYPFELVNNETTDDATKAHTAAGAKRLKDELSQLEAKVDDLFGEIPFEVISGSGINIGGVITSVADGKRSDYIDIDGIDKLYFTNPNNAIQYYNVFYDSSKSKITSFNIAANAKYQEETVPTGAKYLIISVRDSGAMTSVFKSGQIVDTAKNTEGLAQLRTDFDNLSPTRANGILGNFYQNGGDNIVPASADLNDYKTADIIRTEAGVTNAPNSTNSFIVETVVVPWINASRYTAVQKAFAANDPSIVYLRVYESSSNTWGDWKALPLPSQVADTVKYVSQSLTTAQKTQARTNIGAASATAESNIAKFVTGEYINEGSINSINTPGGYAIGASVTDCPGAGGGYLFVVASNSRFIQKYFFHTSGLILYYGVIDTNTNLMLIDWQAINKAPLNSTGNSTTDAISQKAATDYVDNPNRPYATSGSVNDLKKTGGYWVTADVTDRPEGEAAGSVIVTPTFNNGRFIHKKFIAQNGGNIFEQIQDSNNAAVPIMPWTLTNPRANIATFGKNIVCFGDSIFGNYDGTSGNGEGVVSFMHRFGYANTFNCAFGGTTAAIRGHTTHWNDMSFTALVDAIISGDWTAQDYAIEHASDFPAAFAVHLATLKAVDWSTVDIVTVAFGANDFAQNIALGDNTENKNNYTGALLYGISKLMAQYPHIKFVLLSPCWRWYKDASGYYDHDSDTEQNTLNLKLTDYVDANLNLADIIHIPGCDNYHKLGITKYNYTGYFNTGDNADGAHHALYGRKTLAHRIVAFINANC